MAEYGLLAGLVAAVSIVAITSIGGEVRTTLCNAAAAIAGEPFCSDLTDSPQEPGAEGPQDPDASVPEDPDSEADLEPVVIPADDPLLELVAFFEDVVFPMEATGWHTRLATLADLGAPTGAGTLSFTSNEGRVRSCVQAVSGGPVQCTGAMSAAAINVPPGAHAIGYMVSLPGTGRLYAQTLGARLVTSDEEMTVQPFSVSRLIDTEALLAAMSFEDVILPAYTTGARSVMVPFPIRPAENLEVIVTSADGPVAACRSYGLTSLNCSAAGSEATIVAIANSKSAGFRVTPPSDSRLEYAQKVTIEIRSVANPAVSRSWENVTVSRIQAASVLNISDMTFPDRVLDPGQTGTALILSPIVGSYGGNLTLTVTGLSGSNGSFSACYRMAETSGVACHSSSTAGTHSIIVPEGADAVGFRINSLSGDPFVTDTATYRVRLVSAINTAESFTWEPVTVTRPFQPAVFEPAFALTDTTFPVGTSGWQYVYFPLAGEFDAPMRWEFRRVSGPGQSIRACVQTSSGGDTCPSATTGTGSPSTTVEVNVPATSQGIGLFFALPEDAFASWSTTFEARLAVVGQPHLELTGTFTVTRTQQQIIFDPIISFEDM